MMRAVLLLCYVAALFVAAGAVNSSRYGFYRSMLGGRRFAGDGRRVFGGSPVSLREYPCACVLLDRYWTPRCSAAVVSARWALTAAHCVSPHVAYVKYNTQRPAAPEGSQAAVHYLYRHPGYRVKQEDEGRGVDVTALQHDVGLVRTRRDMTLAVPPALQPLHALKMYNPIEIRNEEVQVLGFGRTERSVLGEELFAVKLRLVLCERGAWYHCMCGVAATRAGPDTEELRYNEEARGVCSGDSGGPVVYRGAQVGVTSMGPIECSTGEDPAEGATSVFTALYNYADLINATIYDTEAALTMRMVSSAAPRPHTPAPALAVLQAVAVSLALAPGR